MDLNVVMVFLSQPGNKPVKSFLCSVRIRQDGDVNVEATTG